CARTAASGPSRWIRQGATGMLPTWRGLLSSSGLPTRLAPRPSSPTGSGSTGPSCRSPPKLARRPGSCCSARRCRQSPEHPTACSPLQRRHGCQDGPAARFACPTCRSPRPLWSARPATQSSRQSAGLPPRRPRRRPADPAARLARPDVWSGRTYGPQPDGDVKLAEAGEDVAGVLGGDISEDVAEVVTGAEQLAFDVSAVLSQQLVDGREHAGDVAVQMD